MPKIQHPRFVVFFLVLAGVALACAQMLGIERAFLLGFDVAAALFVISTLSMMRHGTPADLRANAARNDAGRALLLVVVGVLLLAVLVAVGLERNRPGRADAEQVWLAITTLALAWAFGNLAYALHYAHMFYDPDLAGSDRAGLGFRGTAAPDYWDFCYFAFVLGMTFQVSDVKITRSALRRVAIGHGLLAFLFNVGVVALTVNVIGSALTSP